MAHNPVTPIRPVDPVGAVRRVDSGDTYYRQLGLWRLNSETYAAERQAKEWRIQEADFVRVMSCIMRSEQS